MKNKIIAIVLALNLLLTFSPLLIAQAAATPDCGSATNGLTAKNGLCLPSSTGTGVNSATDVNSLVQKIINIILGIVFGIDVLFIIIGGFQYITAGGNEKRAQAGQKTLTNAIIGLVIIIFAYVIVFLVNSTLSK